jgi:hypothetical protein
LAPSSRIAAAVREWRLMGLIRALKQAEIGVLKVAL